MKHQLDMKEGLYFVHGYYMPDRQNVNGKEIYRSEMILLKDSIEDIYDIEAFEVNEREMRMEAKIPQGEFAYYDGQRLSAAENHPTAIMYNELANEISNSINYLNYGNQPLEVSENISEVRSFHINVGHGNCSIIVFREENEWKMWMVDCSVFDFTNKCNYSNHLDVCLSKLAYSLGITYISKLLITHLHYDHINGIEYLIKHGWINKNTEVWMNTHYPWKQATYSRILLGLKAVGVKFIDPIVSNSTKHIYILYPVISFNSRNKAPDDNINNASVLYQICLADKKMLFTGDIETEGWDCVNTCHPYLCDSTYYCISHHGSITGHLRNKCAYPGNTISAVDECAVKSNVQILMGRDKAYSGIFSQKVLNSKFSNIVKTEDAKNYVQLDWETGRVHNI